MRGRVGEGRREGIPELGRVAVEGAIEGIGTSVDEGGISQVFRSEHWLCGHRRASYVST